MTERELLTRTIAFIQWIREIECSGTNIDLGETMNAEAVRICSEYHNICGHDS